MIYRTVAIIPFFAFYIIYFGKAILQKKKGIKTDQLGNGKHKLKNFEFWLKLTSVALPVAELCSIIIGRSYLGIMWKVIGAYFAFTADAIFLLSVVCMKDNWRAGVAKADTGRNLVDSGIYKFSRNPAFLAFDLMYIGMALMYCNAVIIVLTVFAILMFHLQILREEKYLSGVFGSDYTEYKKNTGRYFGYFKARSRFMNIRMLLYLILIIWSAFYFVTILIYAGPFLSWNWLWILIGGFAFVRFSMLKREIEGKNKLRIPKWIKIIYYTCFSLALAFFLFIEGNVVLAMNVSPKDNLDYVIVLGAGLVGETPSNPLRARITEAYTYAINNPDTVIVASGGQGFGESISEAECIKRELVKKGIDENRIILENKSTSTIENLRFSKPLIGDDDASVGIITNSFHEYRAMMIAKKEGYKNIHSVPGQTLYPVGVHYTVREFFGVVRFLMD